MSTLKQIEANRLNAHKSTGPRTLEGKARVSKNALKHGFFSQDVVFLGEDPHGEFPELLDTLYTDWQPQSATEQHLVETLAASMWKLRRAHRIAAGNWEYPGWQRDTRRSVPDGPRGNRELGHYDHGDREHLDRHEAHLHRVIDRSLRQLRQLQASRPSAPPEPVTAASNPIPPPIQQDTATPQNPSPTLSVVPTPPQPLNEG